MTISYRVVAAFGLGVRGEFRRLNRAYNHEGRFVYRQKHDGQSQ